MRLKRIFLSGGRGFLGKNILEQSGHLFHIDAPTSAQLDLTQAKQVDHYFKTNRYDYIIHSAFMGVNRLNNIEQALCLQANLAAFNNLFKYRDEVERFIQIGSGAEYGRPLAVPKITETDLGKNIPGDEYGFAKLICSQLIATLPPARAVNLNLFGVYGPYEDYQTRFISYAIVRSLQQLPIVINQNVEFDYLYVNDFIKLLYLFLEKPAEYSNYNITAGMPLTLHYIAEQVKEILNNPHAIEVKNPEIGPAYSGDNQRLLNFIGDDFKFTNLTVAIKNLAEHYQKLLFEK
jgi:UDP-glucose 4-epimerase